MQLARALRVAAAAAVVGGAACALLLPSASSGAPAGGRPSVKVTERDFSITAPKHVLRSGDVTLTVTNNGPDTHELIVVRSNGKALPLRSDGLTVDETRVEPRTVGSLDGGGPHTTRTLRVHLPPGRYVLFCNMAGHYLGGMHTQLFVR